MAIDPPRKRGRPRKDAGGRTWPIAELARRCKCSLKSATNAVNTGKVSPEAIGTDAKGRRHIRDIDRAVRDYVVHNPEGAARPAGRPVGSVSTPPAVLGASGALPEDLDFEDPDTWPKDARGLAIVEAWWSARHAKRKDDLAAGELLRAEDVKRETFTIVRTMRDHLLRVPDSAAHDVAAELGVSDAQCVRRVLLEAIERGLVEMSRALEASASGT